MGACCVLPARLPYFLLRLPPFTLLDFLPCVEAAIIGATLGIATDFVPLGGTSATQSVIGLSSSADDTGLSHSIRP